MDLRSTFYQAYQVILYIELDYECHIWNINPTHKVPETYLYVYDWKRLDVKSRLYNVFKRMSGIPELELGLLFSPESSSYTIIGRPMLLPPATFLPECFSITKEISTHFKAIEVFVYNVHYKSQ